jgi:hypothetical protein
MRKKDYELIANVLDEQYQGFLYKPEKDVIEYLANELANAFNRVYPKFDRQKFLTV